MKSATDWKQTLWLEIDRGIAAANLDTRAQLVTQETVAEVGKRFEN